MTENKTTPLMTKEEQWENISLSNRFMFYKIFTTYPDKLKKLLEILLDVEIDRITPPQGEKTFDTDIDAKSIRLDIYTKDDNTLYDVELQNVYEKDLPERARYYQGLMDVDTLKHGQVYGNLKNSIVIFICMFDFYKQGLPFYRFENLCTDSPNLKMQDRTVKLFINATAYGKLKNREQRELLKYLAEKNAENSFTSELDTLVSFSRHNAEWRQKFMTFDMELLYAEKHGEARGKEEKALEAAVTMILDFDNPKEKVYEKLGLTEEQILKVEEQLTVK